MKTPLYILGGILAFALLYITLFGLSFLGIHVGGVLKSAQVEVDRKVFEQSVSYQRGQRTEFENLKLQYETSGHPAVCTALKSKFSADTTGLTVTQKNYIASLRCS